MQVEEKLLKKKKSFQQAKYSDYVIFLFYPQTHIRLFFFFLALRVRSYTPADGFQDGSSSEMIASAIMRTHERLYVLISELLL